MAERRLASVDSPSWRARLDAVKAQMEDSSLKVELAEQEMRRAVQSMREEQRASGQAAGVRQRSLADMQELIHGLREEQQQAKANLHATQTALRLARGTALLHQAFMWDRHCAGRALRRWVRAAYALSAVESDAQIRSLEDIVHGERREREETESALRGSTRDHEETSLRSSALSARVEELQTALARRTQLVADEAELARERSLGEVRANEHTARGMPAP